MTGSFIVPPDDARVANTLRILVPSMRETLPEIGRISHVVTGETAPNGERAITVYAEDPDPDSLGLWELTIPRSLVGDIKDDLMTQIQRALPYHERVLRGVFN